MGAGAQDLTRHLNGHRGANAPEFDGHVYDELRRIVAGALKREKGGLDGRGTDLNVTKVCHDVWLKLRRNDRWSSRGHYFGSAARATRQVLVDAAKKAERRQTGQLGDAADDIADALSDADIAMIETMDELIDLCEAAKPGQGRAVELYAFGGLSTGRIAEELGVSDRAVQRYLSAARAEWRRRLGEDAPWADED